MITVKEFQKLNQGGMYIKYIDCNNISYLVKEEYAPKLIESREVLQIMNIARNPLSANTVLYVLVSV